ncbi:MAG TPA: phosphatase PAP2 family protein [Polyangiales bacterium]|nr:phosphatase PAP2 family protein [Polyangiales bacterium]
MPARSRHRTGAFFAAWLWLASSARADDTPYQLYPVADATTIGMSALIWFVPALTLSSFVDAEGCECDPRDLNRLDRSTAGHYRPVLSALGDVSVSALGALALVAESIDVFTDHRAGRPVADFFTDFAVIAEAWLVNGAINQLVKLTATRPRPLLYERALTDPARSNPDNYLSFYSSHASTAFAIGIAYAQTYAYRHPDSAARYWMYAAAIAAGSGIGLTRIFAGKHFPSDVLVGAAAGAAIGWLIPWLHVQAPRTRVSVTLAPSAFGVTLMMQH